MGKLRASLAGLLVNYIFFATGTFAEITSDEVAQLKEANLMVTQLESRNFEEAARTARVGIRSYPENAIFWYGLGSAELQLHHYAEAIRALNETIRLDKTLSPGPSPGTVATKWRSLGDAYRDSGDVEESIDAYKRAIATDKEDARAWNSLSFVYGKLGRDQDAVSAAAEAVRIQPEKLLYLDNLAAAYLKANRFEDGLHLLDHALKLKPDDPVTWYQLGVLYAAYGHRETAEDVYETLETLDPELAERFFLEVLLPTNETGR